MLSEMILESTGLLDLNINTENLEDWLQLANQAEVLELKATLMPRLDPLEEPTTREETKLNSEDSDD